jgi:hypothetical protein
MAVGMLLSILVEGHVPTEDAVQVWLEVTFPKFLFLF